MTFRLARTFSAVLLLAGAASEAFGAPVITIGDGAAFRITLSGGYSDTKYVSVGARLEDGVATIETYGLLSVASLGDTAIASLTQSRAPGIAYTDDVEASYPSGVHVRIRDNGASALFHRSLFQAESNLNGDLVEGLLSGGLVAGAFNAGDYIPTMNVNGHAVGWGEFDRATLRIDDGFGTGPASWTFSVADDTTARPTAFINLEAATAPVFAFELIDLSDGSTIAYAESLDPSYGAYLGNPVVGPGDYAVLVGAPDGTGHVRRDVGYVFTRSETNAGVRITSSFGLEYTFTGTLDPVPVPEPGAASLLLSGLYAGALVVRLRRARSATAAPPA